MVENRLILILAKELNIDEKKIKNIIKISKEPISWKRLSEMAKMHLLKILLKMKMSFHLQILLQVMI